MIPFTDLKQQYLEIKTDIDAAISRVLDTSNYITGTITDEFETKFAEWVGAEACCATGSGTTALMCSMMAIGVTDGDEVITTPHTFISTSEAIIWQGASPVFVDIDDNHQIDIDQIERRITEKTKAILFVDMYGHTPDIDRLREIADRHNLYLVEDAAHSVRSKYKGVQVGSLADLTCFSFNPVKNLGAMGDAGCVTGSRKMMDRVRMYRDHGRIGRYDIVELGYNARIDNMQSNIVLAKLPKLAHWVNRKRAISSYYNAQLQDVVKTVKLDSRVGQGHYVYVIQTPRRDELKQYLDQHGIQTNIHYATTTHLQPAYRKWYTPCPVAERTVNEILSLPCYYSLTEEECKYISNTVRRFFQ